MTIYFVDGSLDEDLIAFVIEGREDCSVIDASRGYTQTCEDIEELFRQNPNTLVLTNCVHLLNFKGVWHVDGIKKTLNPSIFLYKDGRWVRMNELCRIRIENNIETMYRANKFNQLFELKGGL